MKNHNKLYTKIVAALVVGFMLAGVSTHITYTCPPADGEAGCFSYEKALMHPSDFLKNKQDSLIKFSETFAEVSLISFVILYAASLAQKKIA